jgi:hypothetical protein
MSKLFIILFVAFLSETNAQLPPCYLNSQQDFTGLTCSFRFYKTSPPLSLDMPEEVVKNYLLLDSLSKLDYYGFTNFTNQIQLENYNSFKIKEIVKKIMIAKQYDEFRYYLFKYKPDSTLYINCNSIYSYLYDKIKSDSLINLYYNTTAILKVNFNDSINRYNSKFESNGTIYSGKIEEVVYGIEGPICKDLSIPIDKEHFNFSVPEKKLLKVNDCIQINHGVYGNNNFNLKLNKSYYLFLSLKNHCVNYDYAFGSFLISRDLDLKNHDLKYFYQFEVDGDIVSDPQHIFSESGKLTSNQLKSIVFNELEQARKNGTIQRTLLSVEEHNETPFSIYPNPTSNTLSIKGLNNLEKCSIVNSLGIQIFNVEVNPSTIIDINSFPSGLYFLKLKNQNFKFEVIK